MAHGEVLPPHPCTNCGAEGAQSWCPRCGERQPHLHDLTVRHFLHDLLHELVHLDSKVFGTLRTLVAKPGRLTIDFFAGRKTRYITPLRLFLVLFAMQFLLYTLFESVNVFRTQFIVTENPTLRPFFERAAERRGLELEVALERFNASWRSAYSALQLLNIVAYAAVLKVVYSRRKRYYVEHLVFAAHFLAFTYVVSIAIFPLRYYTGLHASLGRSLVSWGANTVIFVYLFFALLHFYEQAKGKTFVKTCLAMGGTLVTALLIHGLSISWAFYRLLS